MDERPLVDRLRATADWNDPPWWWDDPSKTFGHDIGSPGGLLAEAAEALAALGDAEQIVRAVAAVEPLYDNEQGVVGCALCDGYQHDTWTPRPDAPAHTRPAEERPHDERCPWRCSVEWVARQ